MNPEVEKIFATATKLVLGEELSPVDAYGKWLMRHLGEEQKAKSQFQGEELRVIKQYAFMGRIPAGRIIS
jgi:hypothetical protein